MTHPDQGAFYVIPRRNQELNPDVLLAQRRQTHGMDRD
jgi:hypothetical protein